MAFRWASSVREHRRRAVSIARLGSAVTACSVQQGAMFRQPIGEIASSTQAVIEDDSVDAVVMRPG